MHPVGPERPGESLKKLDPTRRRSILEMGCAEGYHTVWLAGRWLHRDAPLHVVREIGFTEVEVFADYDTQFGRRLGLWAQCPGA